MAKYSEKFKLKIVKEYLGGTLGYKSLAKEYGIPAKAQVQRWVRAYQEFGEEGLCRKHSKQVYTVKFKLDALNFMKQTGASYQETAIVFKINNPSLIANWYRTFLKEGIEGLQEKAKGWRPSMSKNHKATSQKQKEELSREERLEREVELLRLENAYLKKLKAFQEDPNAFLEKHKQHWHSNSKKHSN